MQRPLRILFALAINSALALALVHCGGDPALDACNAQCTAQANGKNCSSGFESACKQLCQAIVPNLTGDCQGKAEAAYNCGKDQKWECAAGSDLATEVDPTKCEKENAAYAPCFQQSQK